MTYYIKGGSRYNAANPKVWVGLFLGGFPDADYLLTDWVNLDDKGHETAQDPFYRLGGASGGTKEFELGLWNDFRIKFETTGITYWNGDSWNDLLTGGGGGKDNLYELDDVVIDGTPADNELLAWDNSSGKWINQTAAEASLALSGHGHGQLHDESHSLSSHSSEAHNELTGYNDETDVKHLTDAQLGALHTIYSLEQHNNSYHSTNYHTESDGTGVVTVHSDITSVGSGAIITTGERNNLHTIYSLEQHNNSYHSTNYEVANANIQSHVATPVTDAHHTKTVKYLGSEAVQAVEDAGLVFSSTKLITSANEDLTFTFGRASLGSPTTDVMYLAHRDRLSNNDYAVKQDATGNTFINAITAGEIQFLLNNVEFGSFSANGFQLQNAGARITKFDNGALSNSTTIVPTSGAVQTYVTGFGYTTNASAHDYVEANALTMTQNISFNAGQTFDGKDVSTLGTTAEAVTAVETEDPLQLTGAVQIDTDGGNKKFSVSRLGGASSQGMDMWADDLHFYFDYFQDDVGVEAHSVIFDITSGASGDTAYVFKIKGGNRLVISDDGIDMGAGLDMGANSITNVANVDGQDVSAMATDLALQATPAEALAYVNANGLALAATKVITSANEDLTFTFGRTSIGSPVADTMYLSHRDQLSATEYALKQSADALDTSINAHLNGEVFFRINNAEIGSISVIGLQLGNTGARVTTIENNDALGSSDTKLCTQGNAKAYVDNQVATKDTKEEAHAYVEANALTLTATLTTEDIVLGASKGLIFDADPADDVYNGIIMSIDTTGCGNGDCVYIDGNNSVAIADADNLTKMPVIGIVVGPGRVLTHGTYQNLGDYIFTAGQIIYMTTIAGVPGNTKPAGVGNIVQVIGIATETDTIFINPSLDWVLRK